MRGECYLLGHSPSRLPSKRIFAMSAFDPFNDVLKHRLDISPLSKLVLVTLLIYRSSETDLCFPSIKTIAHVTKSSKRGVIKVIAELELKGFLIIERSHRKNNYYKFSLPDFQQKKRHRVNTVHPKP